MQTARTLALTLAGLGFLGTGQAARAQITGFGDGSAFTTTGFDRDSMNNVVPNDPPTISAGTLTITTGALSEARAAFDNTPQAVGAFVATFTYRNDPTTEPSNGLGAADGFAFVLQNDPRGASAIGAQGAGLGYGLRDNTDPPSGPPLSAISNSAAVEFFLRGSTGGGSAYVTNGDVPFPGTPTGTVDLESGDPILVTLAYDGTNLTETLTDQTTPANTFTTTYAADIPTAVGGGTAFVGFTGGTGGGFSTQTISDFSFAAAPEPSQFASLALGILGLGALALKARRRTA